MLCICEFVTKLKYNDKLYMNKYEHLELTTHVTNYRGTLIWNKLPNTITVTEVIIEVTDKNIYISKL